MTVDDARWLHASIALQLADALALAMLGSHLMALPPRQRASVRAWADTVVDDVLATAATDAALMRDLVALADDDDYS